MFSWSWNDSYSIGIQTIDEQHKQLIKIAGKLQDMLQAGDSVDYYDYIIEAINELKDYTKYHFGYEEEKLKEFNYPDYEDHRMQHLYFVDKIDKISMQDIDNQQLDVISDTLDFLAKWFFSHILNIDTKYVDYVDKNID
ncbi:MAG TPA: bacteriohemerythrin [Thermoclostridium sp.]|nr:bacteriohemerythrin [Thermoclostridium sp.]